MAIAKYYIRDLDELKGLRKLAAGKWKLPRVGFGTTIKTAEGAHAQCRYCRQKILKGEKAIVVDYINGQYPASYQVHFLEKECVVDRRMVREANANAK